MKQSCEFWHKKPPSIAYSHSIELPISPRQQLATKWDPALSEVVDDSEKTLEKSKKLKETVSKKEKAEKWKDGSRSRSRSKENLLTGEFKA